MRHKIARYLAAGTLLTIVSLLFGYAFGVGDSAAQVPATVKISKMKMNQIPQYSLGTLGRKAYTIYLGRGGEKVRAAERMNTLHEIMAEKGYTLADFEPHQENGDLEGWWITYVAEPSVLSQSGIEQSPGEIQPSLEANSDENSQG